MKVVTVEQMRELERRAVESGIAEDALMETAGLGVARYVAQLLDGIRGRRLVVLVGPGNNGGDGMVAARYLADWGALITLYMTSARRRDDKFEECRARRVRVVEGADDPEQWQLGSYLALTDVVIDAVLGIGSDRPLDAELRRLMASIQDLRRESKRAKLVAIDLPTGVDADTGACDDACFPADVTLTLGAPKVGLFRFPGAAYVGRLETVPIGLPEDADSGIGLELADAPMVRGLLPPRPIAAHKGTFGHVAVVAGSRNFVGASVLAAAAAYRAGAGLVTLAAPDTADRIAAPQLLEQVHLPLAETEDGHVAAEAAGPVRALFGRASAAVVGPGLGDAESVRSFLGALLLTEPGLSIPLVIDADGLNALAQTYDWPEKLSAAAVLTPHPGEMSRLLGRPIAEVEEDRVATAREAAARWRQVVVLKGAHTVVAAPDGRAALSPFANPALATAGTGDVLSGIVGSLLAQGAAPYDAAVAGVYVHAAAGEAIRQEIGDAGLLASDLLSRVPVVLRDLRA
ncbi:MAG: NAD(P)H-hydrate dehydratase [Chloroflexi bacterium]|nr:NAD(P)H-hydrate dehydratase [Chloroflexota bacterium]